jgi:hypothetical protein
MSADMGPSEEIAYLRIALAASEAARQQAEQEMRQLLWLNHQCHGQYGDDGEMQCNAKHQNGADHYIGPLDFKRADLHRLASAICSMLRWESMRAEQAEQEKQQLETVLTIECANATDQLRRRLQAEAEVSDLRAQIARLQDLAAEFQENGEKWPSPDFRIAAYRIRQITGEARVPPPQEAAPQ